MVSYYIIFCCSRIRLYNPGFGSTSRELARLWDASYVRNHAYPSSIAKYKPTLWALACFESFRRRALFFLLFFFFLCNLGDFLSVSALPKSTSQPPPLLRPLLDSIPTKPMHIILWATGSIGQLPEGPNKPGKKKSYFYAFLATSYLPDLARVGAFEDLDRVVDLLELHSPCMLKGKRSACLPLAQTKPSLLLALEMATTRFSSLAIGFLVLLLVASMGPSVMAALAPSPPPTPGSGGGNSSSVRELPCTASTLFFSLAFFLSLFY